MVRRDANHPSVVLWGLFNENAGAANAAGDELVAELARLDPTRPIVENSGGAAVGEAGAWAWAGRARCRSPGDAGPRPLGDVHVYLASPLRRKARRLLETIGARPDLDVTPDRPRAERITTPLAGGRVFVSEYGCGGLPNFDAELARYGDEQNLADAGLLRAFRDALERGLHERGLDRVLGDVPTLVRLTQAAQARGVAAQTAALRRNPRVAGYVLTQLADAGWEQMAGLAGVWRAPRPAHAAMTSLNRPRCLLIEPSDPCTTGRVRARIWLLQDPGLDPPTATGTLAISVHPGPELGTGGFDDRHAAEERPAGGVASGGSRRRRRAIEQGAGTMDLGSIKLTLPPRPGTYDLLSTLATDSWHDEATCAVLRLPDETPPDGAGGSDGGRSEVGIPIAPGILTGTDRPFGPCINQDAGRGADGPRSDADVARPGLVRVATDRILVDGARRLSSRDTEEIGARAGASAHVCFAGLIPETSARLGRVLDLPLATHGARGNFMGTFHYVRDHPLFAGLGAPRLADEPFAEVLPTWALAELPGADVLAGGFTMPDGGPGFLWRATVQTLRYGRGRLTFYQLVLGPGGGALGRYLLNRLPAWLGGSGGAPAPRSDAELGHVR